ncbi:lactate permease LctP family transporter [Chitinophaga sp.]|uniref:L-lactate permease n=1 Tax=Chitinophaga sp. TaxID=1869181 RepID=UPI002C4BAEC7|nr:lactate permease LctP family transporter [Chitinophaga sp.]HWV64694.1 lactate permease LctP family transporter [Chitinophaga sp.]
MNWQQIVDPFDNIALSALAAAIPIVFIFWALAIKRMKGHKASLMALLIAIVVVTAMYRMPLQLSLLSALYGALYGIFPICWIILGAVYLFNLTVKSGQFEIIKDFMMSITPDRRLQAILIAFSFGAFLEGASGFGAPIAISTAVLVGFGFNPLYAAGLCLIANTAPVAFGAIGTPIITAAKIADLPEMAISQLVGRTLPFLSVVVPFYLVVMMAGFRKSLEVLPAILVSGITFAFFQWYTSNHLGPMLPDVIAGLASIISLIMLLKYWKPKNIWRFREESKEPGTAAVIRYPPAKICRAWSPFFVMTIIVVAWGIAPVKAALNAMGRIEFYIPGLQNAILEPTGSPLAVEPFEFNFLSAPGTGLLVAALVSLPLMGLRFKEAVTVFFQTLNQLKFPFITIALVMGFAFVARNAGMSMTIAMALASTGRMFPFFSPMLGWLGVFLTGSDTSSNALFCKLQYNSAQATGVDPLVTVSANASGGVTGKMISPQSIAIGAASAGLTGQESNLFRFTVKHSFVMLMVICVITMLQAYWIKWMVPEYKLVTEMAATATKDLSTGFMYLLAVALLLALLSAAILLLNRSRKKYYSQP